jgi:CheY-like chemotaxis protein
MEGKTIKIMIVEDEELLMQAISKKLGLLGFETISCTSAEQALGYLKDLTELPDAIWLDYYLGDMNGFEFMGKLKDNQAWAGIPVFVVSNSASEQKKSSMLALGAKKYLLKAEYKLEDIANIIKDFVEKGG